MSELKPCPFCGGGDIEFIRGTHRVSTKYTCDNCGCALESGETWQAPAAWNTRAAPTMKPWEWVAIELRYGTSATYTCNGFTIVNDDCHGWLAWMNGKDGTRFDLDNKNGHDYWHDSESDAQAACVAYVERKLKEWLI